MVTQDVGPNVEMSVMEGDVHSSCQLCTTMYTTTLYMHVAYSYALNEQGTQHCSLQSSTDPYLPCSAAIKFHNINSKIPYRPCTIHAICSYRPSTAHGLHSFYIQARQTISAMLSIANTLYIAATHNITQSPCTSTCTHHTAFHNPLHTTSKHTKHICVSTKQVVRVT